MLSSSKHPIPTVIVGAGPYGLSLAAHLRAKGVPFRIFGQPMQMWETRIPAGMRLKSAGCASNLSTGAAPYTLAQFCQESHRDYHDTLHPVPVADFVAYGREFARRFVPALETEDISAIRWTGTTFCVTTANGETVFASRIVLATGTGLFQQIPAEFRHLPAARVTDPAQHADFSAFAGRDVTVLGRGAGSLNAAVQLHEAGARVTMITRGRKIRLQAQIDPAARSRFERTFRPLTPLGVGLRCLVASEAPGLLHALPSGVRIALEHSLVEPTGGAILQGRLAGVPMLLGCRIHAIEKADGAGDRLRLTLTDGEGKVRQHLTSHLMAGTRHQTDLNRLRFLSAELRDRLRTDAQGAPKLSRSFESSVPGLHLIGPVAASSFGPLLRFVAGAEFAAARVSLHLQRAWLRERGAVPVEETASVTGPLQAEPRYSVARFEHR